MTRLRKARQSQHRDLRREADCKSIAAAFKGLGNKTRLSIICLLCERERTVLELENVLGMRQAKLSQDLIVLRELKLVNWTRKGRYRSYSLNHEKLRSIIDPLVKLVYDDAGPLRATAVRTQRVNGPHAQR